MTPPLNILSLLAFKLEWVQCYQAQRFSIDPMPGRLHDTILIYVSDIRLSQQPLITILCNRVWLVVGKRCYTKNKYLTHYVDLTDWCLMLFFTCMCILKWICFKSFIFFSLYTGPDIPGFLLQPFRKPKRIRTAFSPSQLLKLEHAFEKNHYVVGAERKQLAQSLSLTETQVSVITIYR